jgi:glycosyltransferase involved in cell wall biosynthesis
MKTAAVVIRRNEGARLVACLEALQGKVTQVVYVDSGSTDGSVAVAGGLGAKVTPLDMNVPFTAARARNAGLAALETGTEFVQFLDGDCVIREGWLKTATVFLSNTPQAAVVCGRRRERFPQVSVYNGLIDAA